jgi:thioredoxin
MKIIKKNMIKINTDEFKNLFSEKENKLINKNNENCILKFSADWCQPCKMLTPILEKISNEKNISVYEINVDNEYKLAEKFNIKSIPTIFFISKTGNINSYIGSASETQINNLILKYFV